MIHPISMIQNGMNDPQSQYKDVDPKRYLKRPEIDDTKCQKRREHQAVDHALYLKSAYRKGDHIYHTVDSFDDRVLLRYGCFAFAAPPPEGQPAEKGDQVEPPQLVAAGHAVGSHKSYILMLRNPVDDHVQEASNGNAI